jgi:asparagine N-glycosylation enzyme membrane subunit Stt3
MVTSLQWIGNNTSNNTVITSWWDFGHLFTYEANRPVTFDGSSQNSPRAYWVGKALLTSNETLSVGILRMLGIKWRSSSFNYGQLYK